MQNLSVDGSASQGWKQQFLLRLHLHASLWVPRALLPASWVSTAHPCPSSQPLVGRRHPHHLEQGIHCPGCCRLRGISPPSSPLHFRHCWCCIYLLPAQNRLHQQSKHPYPNPTAMSLLQGPYPTSNVLPLQQCPHQLPSPPCHQPQCPHWYIFPWPGGSSLPPWEGGREG